MLIVYTVCNKRSWTLSLIIDCGGMEDSKKESMIPTLVYLRKALSKQMLEVSTVFLKV
jgi:hypothetical protein